MTKMDINIKRKNRRFYRGTLAAILAAGMVLAGCGNTADAGQDTGSGSVKVNSAFSTDNAISGSTSSGENGSMGAAGEVTVLDVSDMFTDRDLEVGYDESECVKITLKGSTAEATSSSVKVDGNVVTITDEGTYLLSGTLNGQIIVEAEDKDKVQLVLDGASISCASSAAMYVSQADKVFVTTAAGSENLLETTGEYVAIDDHNIDGAVYSRDDITFNGEGILTVKSAAGNGIVSKDDLKITSGTYEITADNHGLQGKDSIRIANGSITITAAEDGIHSGNDEDETVGYTYIAGGSIKITAGDDAIHSDTQLVIADGSVDITESYEGLEGAEIEIAGGNINVVSSDDGLNGAGGNDGSGSQNNSQRGQDPFAANANNCIIISGGVLNVNAQGDGIDSNGNLYVYGGEITVNGPTNNGNGALDFGGSGYIYDGSVIAIGASGMAENFASDSTQCSILVTTQNMQTAGTKVELKNAAGETLLSTLSAKTFNSVVFSCADIQVGETYTVVIGSETQEIEMTDTIYGSGSGFGGGRGGFGGKGDFNGQDGFGGRGDFGGQDGFGGKGDFGGQDGFGGKGDFGGQDGFGGKGDFDAQDGFGGGHGRKDGFGGKGA